MLRDRPLLIGSLLVVAAAGMFGVLGPVSRFSYDQGVEPLPFVAWRGGLGAVVLGAIIAIGLRRGRSMVRPRDLTWRSAAALLTAGMMVMLLSLGMFAAFSRTTVALVLLCFYTYPAMVAAVFFLLGRERLTPAKLTALTIALVGMVLVVAGNIDGEGGVAVDGLGVLLALGAAACQTLYVTVSRHGFAVVPADQAVLVFLVVTFTGCSVLALTSGAGEALVYPLREPAVLPLLLVAGTIGAAFPSLLFLVGIRRIGGTRAGILALFEPVVGVALAALLLAEALTPIQGLGGAGILVAALILQRSDAATVAPRAPAPGPATDVRKSRREDVREGP